MKTLMAETDKPGLPSGFLYLYVDVVRKGKTW